MGKTIEEFDAIPFVKLWLRQGHHLASNIRVKQATPITPCENQNLIWNLLNLYFNIIVSISCK